MRLLHDELSYAEHMYHVVTQGNMKYYLEHFKEDNELVAQNNNNLLDAYNADVEDCNDRVEVDVDNCEGNVRAEGAENVGLGKNMKNGKNKGKVVTGTVKAIVYGNKKKKKRASSVMMIMEVI